MKFLDPGSGRKIPAKWHDTGAYHKMLSLKPGTKTQLFSKLFFFGAATRFTQGYAAINASSCATRKPYGALFMRHCLDNSPNNSLFGQIESSFPKSSILLLSVATRSPRRSSKRCPGVARPLRLRGVPEEALEGGGGRWGRTSTLTDASRGARRGVIPAETLVQNGTAVDNGTAGGDKP